MSDTKDGVVDCRNQSHQNKRSKNKDPGKRKRRGSRTERSRSQGQGTTLSVNQDVRGMNHSGEQAHG